MDEQMAEAMVKDGVPKEFAEQIASMNTGQRFATGMLVALQVATETKINRNLRTDIFALVCQLVEQSGKLETFKLMLKAKVPVPPEAAFYALKMMDENDKERKRLINLLEVAVKAGWDERYREAGDARAA